MARIGCLSFGVKSAFLGHGSRLWGFGGWFLFGVGWQQHHMVFLGSYSWSDTFFFIVAICCVIIQWKSFTCQTAREVVAQGHQRYAFI
ncbi:hypothetical protein QBC47DRAFT_224580 [Echria macrotheca]|uniref:Uncharacterized protein n=1 Tax=Echria macrotheca TaxID=438768 RepID=A0AAJ0BAI3_9PEZI|nr:hypothetical protein QBC47DRAFT_224580 [Echria macrotheca]